MTNIESILELLEDISPNAYCDDCLSRESGVEPRQQVNIIAHRLASNGRIRREKGTCWTCKRDKIVNAMTKVEAPPLRLGSEAIVERPTERPGREVRGRIAGRVDIEHARTEIVQICHQVWREHKGDAPSHSISVLINALKADSLVPTHQANMMLTLCGLRNAYVYESADLGAREMRIAENALSIVRDWWKKERGI